MLRRTLPKLLLPSLIALIGVVVLIGAGAIWTVDHRRRSAEPTTEPA